MDTLKNQSSKWLLFWGIVLIALGTLAIIFSIFTTLLTVVLLGAIITAGGIVLILDSIKHWNSWKPFFTHFIMGLLYLIVGLMLIYNPVTAAASLTLILGVFYLIIGVFRLIYSFMHFTGWGLLSALISLLLGILILASWPGSSLFIIGLFVGIDLLFAGWTLVMLGLVSKEAVKVK